jgi:hypothetical protein
MMNSDLPRRLDSLLGAHTAEWVTEQQPIEWRPDTWKRYWAEHGLPCPHVVAELEDEYRKHRTIRRRFILDTYEHRTATELFIATMAWGLGPDNRGPSRVKKILAQPAATYKIDATVNAVRRDGAASGFKAYFGQHRLSDLDVAFATKLLYFAGYQSPHRPRPLIYDSRVAAASVRMPTAPLLPFIADGVTTFSYRSYCEWAEAVAKEHETEPPAVEWALFALGLEIRDELQA